MSSRGVERVLDLATSTIRISDLIVDQQLWSVQAGTSIDDARREMEHRGYDVAPITGVPITRYVRAADLTGKGVADDAARDLTPAGVISEDRPLWEALPLLRDRGYLFVRHRQLVAGIVTYADLAQPLFGVLAFGHILAVEAALDHLIDRRNAGAWLQLLADDRRRSIQSLIAERQEAHLDLEPVRCLNLDDRLSLAKKLALASEMGFESTTKLKAWKERVRRLRDCLAHGDSVLGAVPDPREAIDELMKLRHVAVNSWRFVSNESSLVEAFSAAVIWIVDEDGSRKALTGPTAVSLPFDGEAIVLSAENPDGLRLVHAENYARTTRLRGELEARGHAFLDALAGSAAWYERSFLSTSMGIAEALDLGREFGQHSIFVIDASTRKVTRCSDGETLWFAPRTSS